jgi:hypothetical protein
MGDTRVTGVTLSPRRAAWDASWRRGRLQAPTLREPPPIFCAEIAGGGR